MNGFAISQEEDFGLVPTIPLVGYKEEWVGIADAIEHTVLPRLDADGEAFFVTPETVRSTFKAKEATQAAKHYRFPRLDKHTIAHMGFLLRGQAFVAIGEKCESLKAPAGIFVPKGTPFNLHMKVTEQIPSSEWIVCTITDFGAVVTQCRLTPQAHFEGKPHLILHSGLPALLRDRQKLVDKTAVMAILGIIARSHSFLPTFWELLPSFFVEMPSPVRQALQFIHSAYERPIRMKDLAKWCHVNFSHLCRLFRQWVGVSPLGYLMKLRMSAAWKLLTETNLPPILVAAFVGFSKWSHFNAQFAKTFGTSPKEVRKGTVLKSFSNGRNLKGERN